MGDFLLQGNVSLCEEDNLGWSVCVCVWDGVCVCVCVCVCMCVCVCVCWGGRGKLDEY